MQQRLRRPSQRQSTPRRPLPQQQPAPWWHHFSILIGTLRLRFSAWPDIRLGLFLPNAGLEAGTCLCVWADVVSLRHPTDRHQQWFYRVGDYSPASARPSQRQSTPRRPLPQQQPAPWWHHFSILIGTLRLRFSAWPDIRLGLFLPNAGLEAGTCLCVWADVVSLRHPTDRHQQWFYRVGDYSPASACRLMPIFAKNSRARSFGRVLHKSEAP
jgi:hypothetical protein